MSEAMSSVQTEHPRKRQAVVREEPGLTWGWTTPYWTAPSTVDMAGTMAESAPIIGGPSQIASKFRVSHPQGKLLLFPVLDRQRDSAQLSDSSSPSQLSFKSPRLPPRRRRTDCPIGCQYLVAEASRRSAIQLSMALRRIATQMRTPLWRAGIFRPYSVQIARISQPRTFFGGALAAGRSKVLSGKFAAREPPRKTISPPPSWRLHSSDLWSGQSPHLVTSSMSDLRSACFTSSESPCCWTIYGTTRPTTAWPDSTTYSHPTSNSTTNPAIILL
ncbi:hypothetical protein BJX68DRAFT_5723 [Aspergillus pseudodeflectus]|uniref:Uncharacterized protein n=1 Tax=Aspergillus pseudodeflectus TaxID=176178 RepID=A0ABR4LAB7_9EURO